MGNKARSSLILVAVTAMLALTGCGGAVETTERDPDPADTEQQVAAAESSDAPVREPSSAPPSEPAVEGGEAVEAYFEAFSTGQPADMERMVELSATNSPAQTYAQVQLANVQAMRAEMGTGNEPQSMEIVDGEIELCATPVGYEGDQEGGCFRFSDFQTTDGKLASFVAGGTSIEERLSKGGQTLSAGGTKVKLLGAYHSVQSDGLTVAFEAMPGSPQVDPTWYSAEYVEQSGSVVAAVTAYGPDPLRSGRKNIAVVYFDRAPIGGTVTVPAYDADYNEIRLEFDLDKTW